MSFMALPLNSKTQLEVRSAPPQGLANKCRCGCAGSGGGKIFFAGFGVGFAGTHPYNSLPSSFITHAARSVLAIKMTLASGDSPIVKALITAAENGKQVAVLVELKARFDEEQYLLAAVRKSGVHVVYGVEGLKTHSKIVMVVRREADRIRRYVHIGTGNYN